MTTRPQLHIAVAKTKNTASDYNDNFDMTLDYIDDTASDLHTEVTSIQSTLGGKVTALTNIANPTITVLATSGTIALTDNSINVITPTGAITFTLPTISDNTKFHQILVQVNLSTLYSINVGTTYYFNKKAPNMSATGIYNLVYEYDKQNSVWVVGAMKKGTT